MSKKITLTVELEEINNSEYSVTTSSKGLENIRDVIIFYREIEKVLDDLKIKIMADALMQFRYRESFGKN